MLQSSRSLATGTKNLLEKLGTGEWSSPFTDPMNAFNRAIRAYVRLLRIAPEVFDDTVVRREAAAKAATAVLDAELVVALEKVYGPDVFSLGTVARMLDIASRFGRLACGLDWPSLRKVRRAEVSSCDDVDLAESLERA